MRKLVIGILAHVDAGKTTLSEGMLYTCGTLKRLGRVDHQDAFLDTEALERERGITIFSKQAVLPLPGVEVTLLDTPGHVDFSSEMERTLQVLDYAILVISGTDGVQSHTETIWRLLRRYNIPTFIFVNKMDISFLGKDSLAAELKRKLSLGCVEFSGERSKEELCEELAECSEDLMNSFLETGSVPQELISAAIFRREVFPVVYGSALKLKGVETLLRTIDKFAFQPEQSGEFGALIYKITSDDQGARLTHMKITGGSLKVRTLLDCGGKQEKVNQIRVYSGTKFTAVDEAAAGTLCAVTGLTAGRAGEGLGTERDREAPLLEPVLTYRMTLPPKTDIPTTLAKLHGLCDEDPMLRIVWNEQLKEIHVQLMGEIQLEVLKTLIKERFGLDVGFDQGSIAYKETIEAPVEGVGHYEPLRHYAEVHLLLEPGEPGSGMRYECHCSEDILDKNWQRLVYTHLCEKMHRGVLTGSELTDMKITLVAGRAHPKHTEGGDFRQATYRAVRQGLMQAESVLLEPFYAFSLEVKRDYVGRAMTDFERMGAAFNMQEADGDNVVITGEGPVSVIGNYQAEVNAYTKGTGRLALKMAGYRPCHNTEEILENAGYDPEADNENPTGSIFCSHGAGYYVPWQEVSEHMHISSKLEEYLRKDKDAGKMHEESDGNGRGVLRNGGAGGSPSKSGRSRDFGAEDRELEEIFMRTYGKIERKKPGNGSRTIIAQSQYKEEKPQEKVAEYLLVDGYNVIFAWDELKELAKVNIESARNKLMDILSNYQGFKKCTVILVFDAYKVDGDTLEIQKYHNIHVVYTKQAETADQYIEKVVHHIGRKRHVTVVTSDGVEQVVTQGQGSALISSREFYEEVEITRRQIQEEIKERTGGTKNYLFDHMDEAFVKEMEDVRLGKKDI